MAIIEDSPFEVAFGELQRIPTKFISSDVKSPSILVDCLSGILQNSERNLTPVFVRYLQSDQYEAVQNHLVYEAAVQAGLDFVWCIPVNQQMEEQIILESGKTIKVKLKGADKKTLIDALTFIKSADPAFKSIKVEKLATTILSAYNPSWKNFKLLTKLKCGIGAKKAPLLEKYFIL